MITTNLTHARGYIDQADRLLTETYRVSEDPKLFIPVLKLLKRSLDLIENDEISSPIEEKLDAYENRVVEFVRGGALIYADERMRTTTLGLKHVEIALEETKRAYEEAYR